MINDCMRPAEGVGLTVHRPGQGMEAQNGLMDLFMPAGIMSVELWRNGTLIDGFDAHNLVTTQGKNKILEVMFRSDTQITSWYMGLITTTGFGSFAAGDTAAQIAGTNLWTESTVYSGGARKAWAPAAASAGAISNTTVVTFNITSTDTLKGAFIVSASSGTGGTLWAEVAFPTPVPVNNGDDVKVTYTLSS